MHRNKKLIWVAILIALVLVGSTTGVVLARSTNGGEKIGPAVLALTTDNTSSNSLLARAAKILGIDQQKLENAVTQAQREMQQERLDAYLQKMVEQGKITKDDAQKYKNWYLSKPNLPLGFGFDGFGPKGRGGFRGMGGMMAPRNS